MYEYLIISFFYFFFIFSRLSLCTPITYHHRPYPMTCSKRFLGEKGEKRLSFAFSIPSRPQFGRRRKPRLRGTAMFADYPSAAKITVTCFARFLFVSIYFFPTVLCLHTLYAIYNIRRRKKETDTLLCFCRRDSELSS